MKPLRIFIGYDPAEPSAYHVLAHSLISRATAPISITPIARRHLDSVHTRERGPLESTDFSITRFLVPYLCEYRGWALFLDQDMLARHDVTTLCEFADSEMAVGVCKHDYTPKTLTKKAGSVQTKYARKNWSSLMLFNNERCERLTPDYVNEASGLELHQFAWTTDAEIGPIPLHWNWLVGEYPYNGSAHMWHFTLGTPCHEEHQNTPEAAEWLHERDEALHTVTGATE